MFEPANVVEVWAPGVPKGRVGTGYLLGDGLVLTAGHVVDVAEEHPCEVRVLGERVWLNGEVAWRGTGECDVALLRLTEGTVSCAGPSLGRVVGRGPVQARALGFPSAQERPDGVRDTEDLYGKIVPLSAHKSGRLSVSIEGSVPDVGESGHSPWEGMSGAALFSNDLLVGVVVVARTNFGTSRVEAISLTEMCEDPVFQSLATGDAGRPVRLGAVEAVGVLQDPYQNAHEVLAGFDGDATSAAVLLRPDLEVVRFRGREDDLGELEAWCTAPAGLSVCMLWGVGGVGKSRLAAELCLRRQPAGAVAGFLLDRPELDRVGNLCSGAATLIVVDEAHTRYEDVARLLENLAEGTLRAPTRVLLLARGEGDWWTSQLPEELEGTQAAVVLESARVRQLAPVDDTREGRLEAFREAASAFAYAQRLPVPAQLPSPDLSGPDFEAILWVHLAALSAIDRETDLLSGRIVRDDLIEYALKRERRYWKRTAKTQRLELRGPALERAVAIATMLGAKDEDTAASILLAVPDIEEAPALARPVAAWLHSLYPPSSVRRSTAAEEETWLPSLSPEPLGEALIASVLQEVCSLPTRVLDRANTRQAHTALTVLTQTARGHGSARGPLQDAVDHHLPNLGSAAITAAQAAGDPLGPMLADALARSPNPDLAQDLAKAIPSDTVTLRDLAVIAGQQTVEHVRHRPATPERDSDLAVALNNLSGRLSDLGRREDALAAVEEAVVLYRGLAEARPDAFLPALAMALNNLSGSLGGLGRREESLAAIEEAIGVVLPALERAHYFLPDAGLRLAQNYLRRCQEAERQPDNEVLQRMSAVFAAAGLVESDG